VKSIALVQFQISNESSLWWHVNYVMDYYHEKKQELECMYEQVEAQPVSWVVHDKTAYSVSRPLVAYKSTVFLLFGFPKTCCSSQSGAVS